MNWDKGFIAFIIIICVFGVADVAAYVHWLYYVQPVTVHATLTYKGLGLEQVMPIDSLYNIYDFKTDDGNTYTVWTHLKLPYHIGDSTNITVKGPKVISIEINGNMYSTNIPDEYEGYRRHWLMGMMIFVAIVAGIWIYGMRKYGGGKHA